MFAVSVLVDWSKTGQRLVKDWSNTDQILVKYWSKPGSTSAPRVESPAVEERRTSSRADAVNGWI